MNPGKAGVETNRIGVGDEMDFVTARGKLQAEFGGDDAAASVGGVTGDADLHERRVAFRVAVQSEVVMKIKWPLMNADPRKDGRRRRLKPSLQAEACATRSVSSFLKYAICGLLAVSLFAQPNPYRTVENFFKLPEGRAWGSTSTVAVDSKGHIWIAERCGANSCVGKTVDPIMEFDESGRMLKSFGSGLLAFPHGVWIDKEDKIWIADGQARDAKTTGHQVVKFNQDGKVLMTLGKGGVTGDTPDLFNQPNAVAIAPNGDIFISDGHDRSRGNARVLKFTKDGKFIKQWGGHGAGPWHLIRKDACSWAIAPIIGSRSSIRMAVLSASGNSSAGRAESSSTVTM